MDSNTPQSFLIRGNDYIARHPNFKLVGRDEELKRLSRILMRNQANSILLVGAGGVGCTALCLGLEASKQDPNTPFDIINKRLFWLDTDGLFSSGDTTIMNENFQKMLKRLSRYPDTLLIIEDMRDFIEATRNNGCTNFINALMRAIDHKKFQAILECRDEDLEVILKCHSNFGEFYTMLDLQEPDPDSLGSIVRESVNALKTHHHIDISDEAIETAIQLTSKYRVREMSLSRAQPERTLNLLDRAFTSYRQQAHACPPKLREKEELLAQTSDENLRATLIAEIADIKSKWVETQNQLRTLHKNQSDGEEALRKLEDDLEGQRRKDQDSLTERKKDHEAAAEEEQSRSFQPFNMRTAAAGYETREVNDLKAEIKQIQGAIKKNKEAFLTLTQEINKGLELNASHVLAEFSQLSGIPANKLNQDEKVKLLALDKTLSERVFGQDHAVKKLSNAVRVARVGLKDPNKPQASFMFLGPSGVGKTEIAKALTAALHDDERALLRFDMSEYMEKHAVAKLIGAPPGYEGYEAGGILTNAVRRNPYAVILFDEIEKAHPDVFNVFLQVLDDGRLTDNRGLTVSFSEAVIIMTTNIGQAQFLDETLTFEEAEEITLKELDDVYRPEFLNRFNGRQNIVCFDALDLPVIEKIALREIEKLNAQIKAQGKELSIEISSSSLAAICKDHYTPANGARGIGGYFATKIHPVVANTILQAENAKGIMEVTYNSDTKELHIVHPKMAEIEGDRNYA
ncbi:MAG: AAA family ATPase [Alphaproteobacteria bacterium]